MPSVLQKVKKTLRSRTKTNESNVKKRNANKQPSEASKREVTSKNVKKNSGAKRAKSVRTKATAKTVSKEKNKQPSVENGAKSLIRADSCMSIAKSIDLEDDPNELVAVTPKTEIVKREFESKDTKESKESKESKDSKESKETKNSKKERKSANNSRKEKKASKKEVQKSKREKRSERKKKVKEEKEEQKDELTNCLDDRPDGRISRPRMKPWLGMEAATQFVMANNEIEKIRLEYVFLESIASNKTTEAFDANTQRNRDKSPKIYDENRVVLNRPGHENVNYINASLISVKDPTFPHKLIVAQLPRMENESFVEDFWHMIYQEQVTLVYLLVPDDVLQKAPTKLFKEGSGEYQYVGKMFINNRRALVSNDPKEYTIEVLPEGNSDSVMCQVHHHATWRHLQQPPKTRPIIKMIHQFLSEKEITTANVCVVSVLGCGRACGFISSLIAIHQLNKGIVPNICEIMTNIFNQRPKATESFAQYSGIYAIVLDYISRKRGSKTDTANKTLNRFIDALTDVSPPTSPR